jgi:glycosyltransferase involved in cell wall biosynthesis
VIARLNIGGPARHATTLNAQLASQQVESLLVHGSVEPTEGSLEDLVPALGLRAHKIAELGRRIRPWSDLRAFSQLTALLFREQPDVLHTHTAKAGTLGRLAGFVFNLTRSRRHRCVVVHTFHGHVLSGYFGPLGDRAVRTAERALSWVTDRVVSISASQKRDLCEIYRVAPSSRTVVIELGLDLEAFLTLSPDNRVRSELGFGDQHVVFTYVGRLVPIKNIPLLLDAFKRLVARVPEARLVIAGDGELRDSLERSAEAAGLASHVRFLGWRRDLDAIYAGTDVAVLTSRNEGTPVALIEAMAAAHPVIATAVGGVQDVVRNGHNGLVVPPADPEALARAMEELARHPEMRRRLGDIARQDVSHRFSPERLAAEVNQTYREALAEKRGTPQQTAAC